MYDPCAAPARRAFQCDRRAAAFFRLGGGSEDTLVFVQRPFHARQRPFHARQRPRRTPAREPRSGVPRDLLLIGETAAVNPTLFGRPATASAVLARVAFRRTGGCGGIRQREPRAGADLLHDEQPDEQSSQASFAGWRHTRSVTGSSRSSPRVRRGIKSNVTVAILPRPCGKLNGPPARQNLQILREVVLRHAQGVGSRYRDIATGEGAKGGQEKR